uniref:L1 transposable element RRM domain-containing protein n=1 Tax=Sparus aurata TaxID=8175 RepID=A0A671Y240_SPAAU
LQTKCDEDDDTLKDDRKLESFKLAVSSMLATAMKEQQTFIEEQFAKFEERLDNIKAEVTKNSVEIKKLKTDHKGLSTQLTKSEQALQATCCKLEANIAELEDRSRRDNVRIINLPEKVENGDAADFVSSSLSKWFPTLASGKMEVMRAHRIGPERNTGSRTLICKMLRYIDRDRILRAARGSRIEVSGREVRFAADYSNYTIKRRRSFSQAMETARKQGFTPFLIYPAKLKLSRGSEVHLFETHAEAEDFLGAQTRNVLSHSAITYLRVTLYLKYI